jgi:hypothetical protein
MSEERRRFKQSRTLSERLIEEAASLRAQANLLQPGAVRDGLLRKARQCNTGSHMDGWLRSPGLQAPK